MTDCLDSVLKEHTCLRRSAVLSCTLLLLCLMAAGSLQAADVTVAFDKHLREWDGFGANYVEVRHTRDYAVWPQDYSGFKYLSKAERDEIIDLIFGDNGLRVSLVKMFLDPYHEQTPDNENPDVIRMSGFDHTSTTQHMRYFAQEGLKKTRARGEDLQILAGLYAAPGWAIKQGAWGRDLIPEQKFELAEYMISWAKYLRNVERLPVKYLSLHNEEAGNDSWNAKGYPKTNVMTGRMDRGLLWPKEQIADYLGFMRAKLDAQGLHEVGLTPGETRAWGFLNSQSIPDEIISKARAMKNLGLITSHGFMRYETGNKLFRPADYDGTGIEKLLAQNPDLHAWTTSCRLDGFTKDVADIGYMEQMRLQIYETKVNGIIPWAIIHCKWESDRVMDGSFKRSGNSNSPIHVIRTSETSGYYEVRKGYYFYKQLTRAGRPGMQVADVSSNDNAFKVIAFASGDTDNPDSFIVFNTSDSNKPLTIALSGTDATQFTGHLTSESNAGDKNYESIGVVTADNDAISHSIPARSSVVFFARPTSNTVTGNDTNPEPSPTGWSSLDI
ncbi:MAG: hypothetical protein JSW59_11505 [Phycisphaerales bacterium]|nr:MAG: hypothetical protein JSW59_11505 [Phycisphaerales bacterium]